MRQRLAPKASVLVAAVVLGVLGDGIFRAEPWGIGATVWFVSLLGALMVVTTRESTKEVLGRWLWLPMLLAITLSWRSSPSLLIWNALGLMAALGLLALSVVGTHLRNSGIWDYCASAFVTCFKAAIGPVELCTVDAEQERGKTAVTTRRLKAVLRGCLLAAPLVLVFSALLMSADPVFEGVMHAAFDWDLSTIVSHVLLTGFLTWVAAGYVWSIVGESEPIADPPTTSKLARLGIVEIGIGLGVLVALFLIFVVIQIKYLFGGAEVIWATAGLNYAEYARSGFFQLITVAALVVPVLLASHAMLSKENERDVQSYRALAIVILILVAMIMASAVQRMLLYTDAYGLSHDRLYAIAFMAWIGTVLGLFAGTTLFGNGRSFVLCVVLSGFGFLGAMNVMNPDGIIARVNLNRALAGKPLDATYMSKLGDAVPILLDKLPALERQVRCDLVRETSREVDDLESDWRTWNLGRHRMLSAIRSARFDSHLGLCNSYLPEQSDQVESLESGM